LFCETVGNMKVAKQGHVIRVLVKNGGEKTLSGACRKRPCKKGVKASRLVGEHVVSPHNPRNGGKRAESVKLITYANTLAGEDNKRGERDSAKD